MPANGLGATGRSGFVRDRGQSRDGAADRPPLIRCVAVQARKGTEPQITVTVTPPATQCRDHPGPTQVRGDRWGEQRTETVHVAPRYVSPFTSTTSVGPRPGRST